MPEDGTILEQSFDALDNLKLHEEDTEVELEITKATYGKTKDGSKTGITIFFKQVGAEGMVEDIIQWLQYPATDVNSLKRLKYFYEAFGLPTDGSQINLDELKGMTGSAILKIEENDEFGPKNVIKRYVTGH